MNLTNLYFETLLKQEKFKTLKKKWKCLIFNQSHPLKKKRIFVFWKTCSVELAQKLSNPPPHMIIRNHVSMDK